MGTVTEQSVNPVESDSLPYSFIADLHQRPTERIFNPLTDPDADDALHEVRREWARRLKTTVFTSGVYDLLHPDHGAYLLHAKASGAAIRYATEGHRTPWENLSSSQQQKYVRNALGSDVLRLIVSVDGDNSVAVRKGYKEEKGGAPRPIYSWGTRAFMVAEQTYSSPLDFTGKTIMQTADAVTIHGPEDFPENNVHAMHLDLVADLKPDVWVIFGESDDLLETAPRYPDLGNVALRCIANGEGTHYFDDERMGKITTSKVIRRILEK